ncbi:transmembrane protein 267-like [Physella acuta]|uniref:transmembrane protein 267-like n=1 Tax=Physella acuta TaxID=109671 RepID=UPI0027DC5006|nr:transmembrane protein 267-like [Physella acuta]
MAAKISETMWTELIIQCFPNPVATSVLFIIIILVCTFGDNIIITISNMDQVENKHFICALLDSCTHAVVGGLIWTIVSVGSEMFTKCKICLQCIWCSLLAASVDIDHFLVARTLDLKEATQIVGRPPFHNTSLILLFILFFVMIIICKRIKSIFSYILILMLVSSVISHHLRDACHRGLWLSPFGHTPLFPAVLYKSLIVILALILRMCYFLVFRLNKVINL